MCHQLIHFRITFKVIQSKIFFPSLCCDKFYTGFHFHTSLITLANSFLSTFHKLILSDYFLIFNFNQIFCCEHHFFILYQTFFSVESYFTQHFSVYSLQLHLYPFLKKSCSFYHSQK